VDSYIVDMLSTLIYVYIDISLFTRDITPSRFPENLQLHVWYM